MGDLRRLKAASLSDRVPVGVPEAAKAVSSPLRDKQGTWRTNLSSHPDSEWAQYVSEGIEKGFRIGFNHATSQAHLQSARRNMPSADSHRDTIEAYLGEETSLGRIAGPFSRHQFPEVHVSRFGVIPKSTPGKWRLITDLSFPRGASVNDGVDPESCSMHYTTVESLAQEAMSLGKGALLAKTDIKAAYRHIPVHPDDRYLLGVMWRDQLYIDCALPFGLRSAPKVFNAVADAFEWLIRSAGVERVTHYLDDFAVCGPPGSEECAMNLRTVQAVAEMHGIILAPEKTLGPSSSLVFLGIEIDTIRGILRLPEAKLTKLRQMLVAWSGRKVTTVKELQSLLGYLNHACKVVRPGRSFMRNMIALLKVGHSPYHHVRINNSFRADIEWWKLFTESWNGVCVIPPEASQSPDLVFHSDASGQWGCGAVFGRSWCQLQWHEEEKEFSIAFKELVPILLASMIWGRGWRGTRVTVYCDNEAVVCMMASRSSRDPNLMHLLRCLFFVEAAWQFTLSARHIRGVANVLADAVSRNNLDLFFMQFSEADRRATPVPPDFVGLLLDTQLNWTSPAWTRRFATSLSWV